MWDSISATTGIFIGMVILFILLWISYMTRTFIFSGTPTFYPECRSVNYFNDPKGAIDDGHPAEEILSIVRENNLDKMFYQRIPKELCVPGPNQTVHIRHPQFCQFTAVQGDKEFTFQARNIYFEAPFYISEVLSDGKRIDIFTGQNCVPQTNTHPEILVTDGVPVLKWE